MRPPPPLALPLLAALAAPACAAPAASAPAAPPGPARQAELVHLLRQDCGACHGMRLKGGLGSSLLPADIAGLDDDTLVKTILDGRPGTPMPPWRPFLSEEEARWLVGYLRRGGKDE